MARAVIDARESRMLMMWSADPATQVLFDGTRLQGMLPTANDGATVVGVYFRDRSVSKIDYYLHTEATSRRTRATPTRRRRPWSRGCGSTSRPTSSCPPYVDSSFYDHYITEVFLYGPVGASTVSVGGARGRPRRPPPVRRSSTSAGRPRSSPSTSQNGQTASCAATFAGRARRVRPDRGAHDAHDQCHDGHLNEATCG
jgi:hypothetical protein